MTKVFVSGCYDIIHAGHIQFFEEAKALGDHLTVSFASSEVLWHHKQRRSSLPDEHKAALIKSLAVVDEVVIGEGRELGLDFKEAFLAAKPDILAVTEDDQYEELKRPLCDEIGARYVRLPKTPPRFEPVSTTSIVNWVKAPTEAPLRVDFAGGWLDVPRFAREGAWVVNCAISPTVSLRDWSYEKQAGLGGSGAWALLNGRDGVESEVEMGVGWQDPAVIRETGLCVWKSGKTPQLDLKDSGEFLKGRLAIFWTGKPHDTPGIADMPRDYEKIAAAGEVARRAVRERDVKLLGRALSQSYQVQLEEGMDELPQLAGALAAKYCGGGHGGYALYLFPSEEDRAGAIASHAELRAVEPYCRV